MEKIIGRMHGIHGFNIFLLFMNDSGGQCSGAPCNFSRTAQHLYFNMILLFMFTTWSYLVLIASRYLDLRIPIL